MLTLAQYLSSLSFRELSNLAAGDSGHGAIRPDKVPLVVSSINEALLRLYSRFLLKTRSLIIETREWLTEYPLVPEHAVSSPLPGEKFILDVEHPFQDDLIKILEIYDYMGRRLPLNNSSNPHSLYTPKPNVLQIPSPTSTGAYSVTYQAKHPLLTPMDMSQEIEIPDNLLGALSAYVAYLVYNSMNSADAVNTAQRYMQMYAALVQETVETDTANSSYSQDNTRFYKNGWC